MRRLVAPLLSACALAACSDEVFKVPVEGSQQAGASDAWVTVVEFADFQCPYCARAAATMEEVCLSYPEADLRVVFKHLPLWFHERAMSAALAAQCAGEQGLFWPMHDLLYADPTRLEDEDLQAAAQRLGLDLDRWSACLGSGEALDGIERDVALAEELGIEATPTFFVNGYPIVGAQPLETFRELIDRELEKARQSGIGRERYYEQVVLGR